MTNRTLINNEQLEIFNWKITIWGRMNPRGSTIFNAIAHKEDKVLTSTGLTRNLALDNIVRQMPQEHTHLETTHPEPEAPQTQSA